MRDGAPMLERLWRWIGRRFRFPVVVLVAWDKDRERIGECRVTYGGGNVAVCGRAFGDAGDS